MTKTKTAVKGATKKVASKKLATLKAIKKIAKPVEGKKVTKTQLREAWVHALRSGTFRRTHGVLKSDGKYCCLGVACEVYNTLNPGKLEIEVIGNVTVYDGEDGSLPAIVQKAFGFCTMAGGFEKSEKNDALVAEIFGDKFEINNENSLAGINDNGGTFGKIADLIEANPKGLFGSTKMTN